MNRLNGHSFQLAAPSWGRARPSAGDQSQPQAGAAQLHRQPGRGAQGQQQQGGSAPLRPPLVQPRFLSCEAPLPSKLQALPPLCLVEQRHGQKEGHRQLQVDADDVEGGGAAQPLLECAAAQRDCAGGQQVDCFADGAVARCAEAAQPGRQLPLLLQKATQMADTAACVAMQGLSGSGSTMAASASQGASYRGIGG